MVESNEGGVLVHNGLESFLVANLKEKQQMDLIIVELKKLVAEKKIEVFS